MIKFIDSHCHMQDERLVNLLPEVISEAQIAGIAGLICCGTSPDDWGRVSGLAAAYPNFIYPAYGVHPWFVHKINGNWKIELEKHLSSDCVGLGEIGLDFGIRELNKDTQLEIFSQQLELALQYNLAVSIHCRKAWDVMPGVLFRYRNKIRGQIHSYSGGPEFIKHLTEKCGMYISFGGTITRSRNKKGRAAAAEVSSEFLLVETDSPDLAPIQARSEINVPANILYIAASLAEIRNVTVDEIAALTSGNARALYSLTV